MHIVVGAGSAGCLVARRLSDAGIDVLLLEAGPGRPEPAGIRSLDWLRALAEPGWTWESLVASRLDGPEHYWRGRGVGGSSAVNGLVALPGPLDDFVPWLGNEDDVTAARDRVLGVLQPQTMPLGALAAALGAEPAALTIRNGERFSAATAYLDGASSSLRLQSSAEVDRLVLEDDRVIGVQLRTGAVIEADEVWVCAGAIHSPVLLLRSGVSSARLGLGLQDHVANRFVVEWPSRFDAPAAESPPVTGLLTLTSGIGPEADDAQVLVMDRSGISGQAIVLAAVMCIESTGSVSVGTDGEPIVDFNMLSAGQDRRRLDWVTSEVADRLDAAGLAYGQSGTGDYVHATGTCALSAVVDLDGRVFGYRGLRVVDASVIPKIPRANTHVPTLVVAECVAERAITRILE